MDRRRNEVARWSEEQYRDYRETLASRYAPVQLPLGRVEGLSKPKRINASAQEWQEAKWLMDWVRGPGAMAYPELEFLYAVPNGGFRHKVVAGKMKAQGVKAGVLDFNLDVARGGYHGLHIELKRSVGGTVSDAQKLWIAWLTTQGYLAVVCRGWEEAKDSLVNYLCGRMVSKT